MRQLAVLAFVVAVLGIGADAFAQEKGKGITYLKVSASKCKSVCMQRGWSADNCKAYCRPGCRQAKTGGEHFCVVGKR